MPENTYIGQEHQNRTRAEGSSKLIVYTKVEQSRVSKNCTKY